MHLYSRVAEAAEISELQIRKCSKFVGMRERNWVMKPNAYRIVRGNLAVCGICESMFSNILKSSCYL